MKILVDAHRDNLATVITRPNLLERLLLCRVEEERFAVRVRALFGGYDWVWDGTFAPVGDRVEREICRAIAERHPVGGLA